jgi:xanthine dehydrogenase YagR molybdenum-binding subunit
MTVLSVGQALPRVDGREKVTGQTRYAAEFEVPRCAHAVLVQSSISKGRIVSLDATEAERLPGVLTVISHQNAPRLPYREHRGSVDPAVGERLHVLQDDVIRFFGQFVAIVVAETQEQADHAATRVAVTYAREPGFVDFIASLGRSVVPEAGLRPGARTPADTSRGEPDAALSTAAVRVDRTFHMAREDHNAMEPHAIIAMWNDDGLSVWTKTQYVVNERDELAAVFGLPSANVRVISPFVGGAFGSALRTWPHVTLAALAARQINRPIKLVLNRRQMFAGTGYRPQSRQRVALGATADGRLSALIQESTCETSRYEQFTERIATVSRYLYSCPNVRTRYRLVPLDVSTPTHMRGPGESSGIFALESAMDELAIELGMDPIELRLQNEPAFDEDAGLPFSSRSLQECYQLGADRFGWSRRSSRPTSMRDGKLLVGWGTASATYPALWSPASARAYIFTDGTAVVQAASSDMGPGTYTSMTQVAADALGLPQDRVRIHLGDSALPPTPSHGGSHTIASVGSAVRTACLAVQEAILELAAKDANSPLYGAISTEVEAAEGRLFWMADDARGESYGEILVRNGRTSIHVSVSSQAAAEHHCFSMHCFGAIFADVAIDPDLGAISVRRLVGAYDVGRIVNPLLARSQCIGGMVGGTGMALMEHTVVDGRDGRLANASLVDYLVPVNADIGELTALFVDKDDPCISPLGAKGLAEIAIVGVAPAIANAVFHATGRRVRELPITLDKLL